jgi:hypothetical protein
VGVFKHRPRVSLFLPRELEVGRRHDAKVVLTARRPVVVDWIDVAIEGVERGVVGSGKSARTLRRHALKLGARLGEAHTLAQGQTELPFTFDLPPDLPASYRGSLCGVDYTAAVRASIPWWPDAYAAFDLCVVRGRGPEPPEQPALFSSDPSGPRAQEPHVEGSLATSVVEPGGVVAGALALGNVAHNAYVGLEVGLVSTEAVLVDGEVRALAEATRFALSLPAEGLVDGASVPFRFRIPDTAAPTLSATLARLDWSFFVTAKIRWRSDITMYVPVVVVPRAAGGAAVERPRRAPPTVGSERVERLWREVAEERGLAYEAGRLSGRVGEVSFDVVREHRGRRGVFLAAHFTYPSLHLDLRLEPVESSLRRLALRVASDETSWDRRYSLTGRDRSQAVAFADRLRPLLEWVGALTVRDDAAQIDVSGSGQRRDRLASFAAGALEAARVFEAARRAIPAPAAFAATLEAWERFAERLGGSVETARMIATGRLDSAPVEVRTEWSSGGEPDRTVLTVRPLAAIGRDREIHLAAPGGAGGTLDAGASPASLDRAAAALLASLCRDARAFDLCADEVVLVLPGPALDPAPLLERLASMLRLHEAVRAGHGPFR